jgi:hypothetical protein
VRNHGFSITELDDMLPGERMIYVELLSQALREEEKARKDIEAVLRRQNA